MEWGATICGFCPQEVHSGYMDLTLKHPIFCGEVVVAFSEPRAQLQLSPSPSVQTFPPCPITPRLSPVQLSLP